MHYRKCNGMIFLDNHLWLVTLLHWTVQINYILYTGLFRSVNMYSSCFQKYVMQINLNFFF